MYKNGAYISQNMLKKVYGIKTNFLEYHRVITCVSGLLAKLKLKCSENVKPNYPNNLSLLLKAIKGSKDFYRTLTDTDSQNRPIYSFWEESFRTTISYSDWNKIFKTCFKTVKDNFLIWSQYRILYRILGTKDYLFTMKITTDRTCAFCGSGVETVKHLFVDCEKVKKFWGEIQTFIKLNLAVDFPINGINIIFGLFAENSHSALNTIYMAAKTYIFQNSKSNGQINLQNFIRYLNKIYLEQEYVARLEQNYDVFLKQWNKFNKMFVGLN